MIVGFFGCFGAVRESQCLLASVKSNHGNILMHFVNTVLALKYNIFCFLQFFACLLIIFGAEIVAGVFGFINKEQVHYSYLDAWVQNLLSLLLLSQFIWTNCQHQIVEDVQSFYSNSLTDASSSNGTAIIYIYHKTVSQVWFTVDAP